MGTVNIEKKKVKKEFKNFEFQTSLNQMKAKKNFEATSKKVNKI